MEFDYLLIPRLVALILATAAAWAFCLIYQITTQGHWRDTEHGVHLMAFTAVTGLVFTYILCSVLGWVPREWIPVASFLIYASEAALIVWRIVLLLRTQRRKD